MMEQYGIYLKGSSFLLLEARTKKGQKDFFWIWNFRIRKMEYLKEIYMKLEE